MDVQAFGNTLYQALSKELRAKDAILEWQSFKEDPGAREMFRVRIRARTMHPCMWGRAIVFSPEMVEDAPQRVIDKVRSVLMEAVLFTPGQFKTPKLRTVQERLSYFDALVKAQAATIAMKDAQLAYLRAALKAIRTDFAPRLREALAESHATLASHHRLHPTRALNTAIEIAEQIDHLAQSARDLAAEVPHRVNEPLTDEEFAELIVPGVERVEEAMVKLAELQAEGELTPPERPSEDGSDRPVLFSDFHGKKQARRRPCR